MTIDTSMITMAEQCLKFLTLKSLTKNLIEKLNLHLQICFCHMKAVLGFVKLYEHATYCGKACLMIILTCKNNFL